MPSLFPRIAIPVLMLAAASQALADNDVIREHQFDLRAIDTLEIHASVGSIDIVPASGDQLEVILRIEGKKDGWFGGARDVSDIDLEPRERNGRLTLEQTAENTETHWLIRLPVVATTKLSLGVGAIKGDLPATAVEVHVGVGEVDIDYPGPAAGEMRLKVGVGDAGIQGDADIHTRRAFVSQNISASGRGIQDIDIDVGVGNIALQLL